MSDKNKEMEEANNQNVNETNPENSGANII